ncbi:MAG: hypothetical protein MUF61_02325 [archaeon]|jgi:hypothetical protein|nr:hypothetical protein [archaeon]
MKKPISTAYFGSIFFDYILQDRMADAVFILPNYPSHNSYSKLAKLFYGRGYHVFVPRYRGTYQSNGKFLGKNVVDDMLAFMKNFEKGVIKNNWDGKKYTFKMNKRILLAGGFSGAIACGMAAKSNMFSHLILASPIWDFDSHNSEGKEQDLSEMTEFVRKAYQNCYRFGFRNIKKVLAKYKEIHPDFYLPKLHHSKFPMLLFHDPNDKVVSFTKTKSVVERLPNVTFIEHYLGHGLTDDLIQVYWKDVEKFIKINYLREEEREKEIAKEQAEEEKVKEIEKFEKAVKKAEKEDVVEMKVVGSENK